MTEHEAISVSALYTPAEHSQADRNAIASGTGFDDLVARAGAAVAEAVQSLRQPRVVVLCGPGNNGADGRVAAELLTAEGVDVAVREWPGDADAMVLDLAELRAPREVTIVDGLLGSGLSRPVGTDLAAVIDAVAAARAAGAAVVSIDVPSGLDGATGQPSPVAVTADVTVTFSHLKPGHLLVPGRLSCGDVRVFPIGIPAAAFPAPTLWENGPGLWTLPSRSVGGHKYSAGHCVVVSGDRWHTGASRLAALAALRTGAGAVTVAADPDALDVHAHHLTEIMLCPIIQPTDLAAFIADRRINTIAIGPALGVGGAAHELLNTAIGSDAAVVADADAITIMSEDRDRWLTRLRGRSATVLTPHEAEFSRLFGDLDGGAGKVTVTRDAAAASGAVVVYKGADTVVAAPDGRAVINTNAPPSLATAGSGDVLTGITAGLLAQGMDPFDAACAAVWLHGDAADRSPTRLIASDLITALRG